MKKHSIAIASLAVGALFYKGVRRIRLAAASEKLSESVVIITGGSRGLGLEIARECGVRGARLVLAARDPHELAGAKGLLVKEGLEEGNILVQQCDVRSDGDVKQLITAALSWAGRIDTLINVAGVITVGPATAFRLQDFEETMQLNFLGAVRTSEAVLPLMIKERSGAIVNIGSIGGKVAFPHLLPYTASKFALVGWSKGLRTEVAPYGVKVTTVNPGVLQTGSHVQAFFKGDAAKEYRWFGSAATARVTATACRVAAQHVVEALLLGTPEIEIGFAAKIAARLAGAAPTLTGGALRIINRYLPKARGTVGYEGNPIKQGWQFRGTLPDFLEPRSERNIQAQHQQPPSYAAEL